MHVAVVVPRVPVFLAAVPPDDHLFVWLLTTTALTAVLACALALFLVVRAGARPDALALALFLAFLSVSWGSILHFASVGPDAAGKVTAVVSVTGRLGMAAAVAYSLAASALLRFSALFPVTLRSERVGRGLRWLRIQLLEPVHVWMVGITIPFVPLALLQVAEWGGFDPAAFQQGTGHHFFLIALAAVAAWLLLVPLLEIGLAVMNLVDGHRAASPGDRRRSLWVLAGSALAFWMLLAPFLVGLLGVVLDVGPAADVAAVAAVLAPLVLVLALGMAVLYAGALDPALALKRGTVLGALGLVALLTFAGLENALSNLVQEHLGLPGTVGSILAGAVAAGVMLPLHRVLNRLARRTSPQPAMDPPEG